MISAGPIPSSAQIVGTMITPARVAPRFGIMSSRPAITPSASAKLEPSSQAVTPCVVPAMTAITTTPTAQRDTAWVTRSHTSSQRVSSPGLSTLASERFRFPTSVSRKRHVKSTVKPATKIVKKSPAMPSRAEIASGTDAATFSAPDCRFPPAPVSPSQSSSPDSRSCSTVWGSCWRKSRTDATSGTSRRRASTTTATAAPSTTAVAASPRDRPVFAITSRTGFSKTSARKMPRKTSRKVLPMATNAAIRPMAAAATSTVRIGSRSSTRRFGIGVSGSATGRAVSARTMSPPERPELDRPRVGNLARRLTAQELDAQDHDRRRRNYQRRARGLHGRRPEEQQQEEPRGDPVGDFGAGEIRGEGPPRAHRARGHAAEPDSQQQDQPEAYEREAAVSELCSEDVPRVLRGRLHGLRVDQVVDDVGAADAADDEHEQARQ